MKKLKPIIVICTRNNEKKLVYSLKVIALYNKDIPVLVHEQCSRSKIPKNKNFIQSFSAYSQGISKSRNEAVKKVKNYDLIIWLDDDSIVSKSFFNAIKEICSTQHDKKCAGYFGRTIPFEASRGENVYCPSTHEIKENSIIQGIPNSSGKLGHSNNFIIFSHVFEMIGGFNEWLGAGSLNNGAEDAEFVIRCLINGYFFKQKKELLIFHNKWLSDKDEIKQNRQYICGGVATYSFYTFLGVKKCNILLSEHFNWALKNIFNHLHALPILRPWKWRSGLLQISQELNSVLVGVYIGLIQSLKKRFLSRCP